MKKNLIIMAAGLLALTACKSDDEPTPQLPSTDVPEQTSVADQVNPSEPAVLEMEDNTQIGGIDVTYENGQVLSFVGASSIQGQRCVSVYGISGNATDVVIPSTVTTKGGTVYRVSDVSLGYYTETTGVKTLTLPTSIQYSPVTNLFTQSLTHLVSLERVYLAEGTTAYATIDGAVYSTDLSTFVWCPCGRSGSFAIANGTETIAEEAFNGTDKLTQIVVPASVKEIEDNAFLDTKTLIALDMLGTEAPEAGEYAFGYYTRQATLRIPTGSKGSYFVSLPTLTKPLQPMVPHNPGADATEEELAKYAEELEAYNTAMAEYEQKLAEYEEAMAPYENHAGYQFFKNVQEVTFTTK